MFDILKNVRGYLRIRVSGFAPERFINLCSNKDILLWDIRKERDGYVMCISLPGFYRLKNIARKTRTKVVVLERNGLPFLFPVMRKRSVFLTGFLLALIFWHVSGYFVWEIEISGNYKITRDQMESFLEEHQIYEGMRKADLDIGELEKEIRRSFPVVTWTSAQLDGTKLDIRIKENDAGLLEMENGQRMVEGTDLVAEFEGRIVSMVVRSGIPKVKIGDVVEKGTVLVDGKIPINNEDGTIKQYLITDADADIVIEHDTNFEASLPYDHLERELTGRQKVQYFIRIGAGGEYKIPVEKPYLYYDRIMRLGRPVLFEKLKIPICAGSYTYREYLNVEHGYSDEEAEKLLNKEFVQFLESLEQKGVHIIEKDVKIDTNTKGYILRGTLLVEEQAGGRTKTDRGEDSSEE